MDNLTSWRLGCTPGQMREVDRRARLDFGIEPVQLMEVAGLQTAHAVREIFGPPRGRAVCILAGKGNNGADGLVAARRLSAWGARVSVCTSFDPAEAGGLLATHLGTLRAMGIPVTPWKGSLPAADAYVDALLGFGATGSPHGAVAEVIASRPFPVLALDLPSGLDATTGTVGLPCIEATATVTLALPKVGLLQPGAAGVVGTLLLADIGIPMKLLQGLGIDTSGLFEVGDLVRLARG